jgi:beta-galactosidase/beta-glucuronidase
MLQAAPQRSDPSDYPRPQLRRQEWMPLNGIWQFAIDDLAEFESPGDLSWDASIRIPFAPETKASGVMDCGYYRRCWYQIEFEVALVQNHRLILHFGAVDFRARVWLNAKLLIEHEGGFTPFCVDITNSLREDGLQILSVRVDDDPHDLAKPRGKQDWQLEPHSIWYPRTSGIWQTVWLEWVPKSYIKSVRWGSSLERWELSLEAYIDGPQQEGLFLDVKLFVGKTALLADRYSVSAGEVHRRIALSDPGIDDFRNELLWSPASPTLIQAEINLLGANGQVIDKVYSYTALRSIGVQGNRFTLNGRPFPLRLVLDQGYWPETGLTPPNTEALRLDVELARAMGFNGVRKHQKLEDPRYLFWADTIGLLVWEEMPSAYRFTGRSVERLVSEWMEAIHRDTSHPCIVAWVPFNESWGVPDLPDSAAQRHYVQALYHLTKTLDATRPVIGNDGWESVATDIIGIHDYDEYPERIAARYGAEERLPWLLKRERPGGRLLHLAGHEPHEQPIVLSEFGGIAYAVGDAKAWGYSEVKSSEDLAQRYTGLLKVVRSLNLFAGFCYTQFADTYQEANGLLYADRMPKCSLEVIAAATYGTLDYDPSA